jgi:biopolymer transport protein TolQ
VLSGLAVPAAPAYAGGDVFDMILRAAGFSKVILLILFAFSVASWAIILERWWTFRGAERRARAFLMNFRRADSLTSFWLGAGRNRDNPLARIFHQAMKQVGANPGNPQPAAALEARDSGPKAPVSVETLRRVLEQSTTEELALLERNLGFLATTGSTCPFIGLLGTVWGVMSAFMSMGREGSASLTVVAPGIAEALIVTAMGLFAAIPAVIGYNLFVTRSQRFARRMDSFGLEILNRVEKGIG